MGMKKHAKLNFACVFICQCADQIVQGQFHRADAVRVSHPRQLEAIGFRPFITCDADPHRAGRFLAVRVRAGCPGQADADVGIEFLPDSQSHRFSRFLTDDGMRFEKFPRHAELLDFHLLIIGDDTAIQHGARPSDGSEFRLEQPCRQALCRRNRFALLLQQIDRFRGESVIIIAVQIVADAFQDFFFRAVDQFPCLIRRVRLRRDA